METQSREILFYSEAVLMLSGINRIAFSNQYQMKLPHLHLKKYPVIFSETSPPHPNYHLTTKYSNHGLDGVFPYLNLQYCT